MSKHWTLSADARPSETRAFGSLEAVFALKGEFITRDPLSRVLRVTANGTRYYVKLYTGAAKNPLRRWVAPPRVKTEWKNLKRFAEWDIPTARIVARGLERSFGGFIRGALITEELRNTEDLASLARNNDARLHDNQWVTAVSRQVADAVRKLHSHRFAHNDLKWRNILVDKGTPPRVYFIDCPGGAFWPYPFISYRKLKDIACLDKIAKHHLSNTQRLRFFLRYRSHTRLTQSDKRFIRQTLRFFEGRE